jgi:hypothetical protein
MTAEGVFPKIAGDIAYASEANRFASFKTLYIGSTILTGSSTTYVTVGSTLVPANTFGANACLHFQFSTTGPCGVNFGFSGTTGEQGMPSAPNLGAIVHGDGYLIVGPTMSGAGRINWVATNDQTTTSMSTRIYNDGVQHNFNAGSSFVIKYALAHSGAGNVGFRNLNIWGNTIF